MTPQLQQAIKVVKTLTEAEQDELIQIILENKQNQSGTLTVNIPDSLIIWQAPAYQPTDQPVDFWPPEETADDINEFVRQQRQVPFSFEQDNLPD